MIWLNALVIKKKVTLNQKSIIRIKIYSIRPCLSFSTFALDGSYDILWKHNWSLTAQVWLFKESVKTDSITYIK